MDIFVSLKEIINRINRLDERYKNNFINGTSSTNPFSFVQNKTFVWIEKPKQEPQCNIDEFRKLDN